MASTPAVTQLPVIILGQEATNMARAANAGFIKLCPNPPKACFTMATAKADPIRAIHHGALAGKLNANKIPVTTALKSVIVTFFFLNF